MIREIEAARRQKEDTKYLIKTTKSQLKEYLRQINTIQGSDYSLIKVYKWFIIKEKSLYITLNMLKQGEKLLMGLMWCPTKMKPELDKQLYEIRERRNIDGPQIRLM